MLSLHALIALSCITFGLTDGVNAFPLVRDTGSSVRHIYARDATCTPGEFRCDGISLQQCAKATWVTLQVCSSSTVCSAPKNSKARIGCLSAEQAQQQQQALSAAATEVVSSTQAAVPTASSTSTLAVPTSTRTTKKGPGKTFVSTYTPPGSTVVAPSSANAVSSVQVVPSVSQHTPVSAATSSAVQTKSSVAFSSAPPATSSVVKTSSLPVPTTSATISSTAISSASSSSTSAVTPIKFGPSTKFVVYSDYPYLATPPTAAALGSITHFILAFWLSSPSLGAVDNAAGWTSLSAKARASIKVDYASHGKKLMVSAFGATDTPTSSGYDPIAVATRLAKFVKEYDLDGVDIDYEDFPAYSSGTAIPWLLTFQTHLRSLLPSPQFAISHAPLAPWLGAPTSSNPQTYLTLHKTLPKGSIDWYNVQFYNQGEQEYTTCEGLMRRSSKVWPGTSLGEIGEAMGGEGVGRLVVGKPSERGQAVNGFMSPEELKICLDEAEGEAKKKGGEGIGGAMMWQWNGSGTSKADFLTLAGAK